MGSTQGPVARRAPRRKSLHVAVGTLCLCTLLSGCSNLKPWVKPYQRDRLALPYMALERHSLASGYMHHAYQSREGARGAEGGSGGGCGCN